MTGCPTPNADSAIAVADALRTVDCYAGQTTAASFGRLFGSGGALSTALTLALTLYVALFAISMITGRSRLSLSSLTPRMMTLGLVLTFATSWAAYQNVVWTILSTAPDWLASTLLGSKSSAVAMFADSLDSVFQSVADAAEAAKAADPNGRGLGAADLLWMSALLLLLGTVGVLVVSKIALATLLALGPIFIVFALFNGTRGLFEGWLKAAVAFALVPLLTVLIGGVGMMFIGPVADGLPNGVPSMKAAAGMFLAAAIHCALMAMVLGTAKSLTASWHPLGRVSGHDAERAQVDGVYADQRDRLVHAEAPPAPPPASASVNERVRHIPAHITAPPPVAANDSQPHSDRGTLIQTQTQVVSRIADLPVVTARPSQNADRRRAITNALRPAAKPTPVIGKD